MSEYICIDIGGTTIKHGVINADQVFVESSQTLTEAAKGGPAILEKVLQIIENYLAGHTISGICVSTAGMVDCEKGEIFHASPLIPHYTGTKIKETIEKQFSIPCEVENDVNCAGLAEHFAGAGKGCSVTLCLTVGTGIGGCIIINDRIFHGYSGSACEVGYMHLPGGEFQDLGATSILVKKVAKCSPLRDHPVTGKKIFQKAKQGDKICREAIEEMCDTLGRGIANVCYVLNPEIVILGGGIMAQREYLKPLIEKSLKKYLIEPVYKKTRLAFAENGNQAGMLGAYFHFKQRHTAQ